jgi:hypothetical protein
MYLEMTLSGGVVMQAMDGQAPKVLQSFVAGCDAEASPLSWRLALAGDPSFLFRYPTKSLLS